MDTILVVNAGSSNVKFQVFERPDSRTSVYVLPTDEELAIAQHTLALPMNRQSLNPKPARAS